MPKTLSDYYVELRNAVPYMSTWKGFSRGDVAIWLQQRFDLSRKQALGISRILWLWIWFGYVPAKCYWE